MGQLRAASTFHLSIEKRNVHESRIEIELLLLMQNYQIPVICGGHVWHGCDLNCRLGKTFVLQAPHFRMVSIDFVHVTIIMKLWIIMYNERKKFQLIILFSIPEQGNCTNKIKRNQNIRAILLMIVDYRTYNLYENQCDRRRRTMSH